MGFYAQHKHGYLNCYFLDVKENSFPSVRSEIVYPTVLIDYNKDNKIIGIELQVDVEKICCFDDGEYYVVTFLHDTDRVLDARYRLITKDTMFDLIIDQEQIVGYEVSKECLNKF